MSWAQVALAPPKVRLKPEATVEIGTKNEAQNESENPTAKYNWAPTPPGRSCFSSDISNSSNSTPDRIIVLDTSAFLKKTDFGHYGKVFYTVPEVIKEVKDSQSREFRENCFTEVLVQEPDPHALRIVESFSKKTGDYSELSYTDLKVLALAYSLEQYTHNGSADHLRKEPPMPSLADINNNDIYLPVENYSIKKKSSDENETEKVSPCDNNYNINSSDNDFNNNNNKSKNNERSFTLNNSDSGIIKISNDPSLESNFENANENENNSDNQYEIIKSLQEKIIGFGDFDSDDEDSGWINNENIKNYTKKYIGMDILHDKVKEDIRVAIITSDYSIQNVLLQMGMNLISVDGRHITHSHKWIRRCFSCGRICKNQKALFCSECGYATLVRIQYFVDSDGNVFMGEMPKINIRNTKYPIPHPKNKKLILTEADLPTNGIHNRRKKKNNGDYEFGVSKKKISDTIVVGYGKKGTFQGKKC